MIIQRLQKGKNKDDLLYIRYDGNIYEENEKIVLSKNAVIDTSTYFNSCSVGKWFTYCNIEKMQLTLIYSGRITLKIEHANFKNHEYVKECLYISNLVSDEKETVSYAIPHDLKGVVSFSVQALTDNTVLYDSFYECDTKNERDIVLALNICTYKREKYLMRNLSVLQNSFLQNEDSVLHNHLKVFITDNGNTLDCKKMSDGEVFVCHNPNVGGAGGFTRGLLEIKKRKEADGITNAIFMDDDVEIEPEGIRRTYILLKLLKEKYRDNFISGAMLRLDEHYVQHENGALWNAGRCRFINRGLDLRYFKNVVINEIEYERDYAAWWYCCIPVNIIKEDNLPIPVFIHQDDTEYSLRNTKKLITMNGIAIWHPVADHKRVSSNEYYNLRNMLIVNSMYCPEYGCKQLEKKIITNLLLALLRMRYKDMNLIYKALEDFCKGPDWLLQVDPVAYHKKIQQAGYQMLDMEEKIAGLKTSANSSYSELDSMKKIIKDAQKSGTLGKLVMQIITLNGWLLPKKKDVYIFSMGVHPIALYRMGRAILYDEVSKQGIEVQRSFRQIFIFMGLVIKSVLLIRGKYEKSKSTYQRQFKQLQSVEYWNRVLEI